MERLNEDGELEYVTYIVMLSIDNKPAIPVSEYRMRYHAVKRRNNLNGFRGYHAFIKERIWPE